MKSVMGLKILLVDDEPDIVEVIQDRLEAYGFTVVTAGTGLEALKKLSVEKFDGVFLDVKMPEMGGYRSFGRDPEKRHENSRYHHHVIVHSRSRHRRYCQRCQ